MTCLGDRILSTNCECAPGKFEDGKNALCQNCDNKCSTCAITKLKCLTCKGDRITDLCICPDGFYDDGVGEFCLPCSLTCNTCDMYGCTSCKFNRIGPFSSKCICNAD